MEKKERNFEVNLSQLQIEYKVTVGLFTGSQKSYSSLETNETSNRFSDLPNYPKSTNVTVEPCCKRASNVFFACDLSKHGLTLILFDGP